MTESEARGILGTIFQNKQNLRDLIATAEGSIVSKILVDRPHASITLFAFDKGQSLSAHKVSHDAMIYVFEGTAAIDIEGEKCVLKKEDMIVMPANKAHAVRADEKLLALLIIFKD